MTHVRAHTTHEVHVTAEGPEGEEVAVVWSGMKDKPTHDDRSELERGVMEMFEAFFGGPCIRLHMSVNKVGGDA